MKVSHFFDRTTYVTIGIRQDCHLSKGEISNHVHVRAYLCLRSYVERRNRMNLERELNFKLFAERDKVWTGGVSSSLGKPRLFTFRVEEPRVGRANFKFRAIGHFLVTRFSAVRKLHEATIRKMAIYIKPNRTAICEKNYNYTFKTFILHFQGLTLNVHCILKYLKKHSFDIIQDNMINSKCIFKSSFFGEVN